MTPPREKQHRGFRAMSKAQRSAIASLGGRAAQAKGTAHRWSKEEAQDAGMKGWLARQAKKAS